MIKRETKNMNQKISCHHFTMAVPGEQRNPSVHIDQVLFYVWHRLLQNEGFVAS